MSLSLEQQTKETAALLRRKKSLVAARSNAGEEIEVAELIAISKLEMRLANLETYVRLAAMTREEAQELDAGPEAEAR